MMRVFVKVVILVAVLVGLLNMMLNRDQLEPVFVFRDFFDVALPILAVGALVKFLISGTCGYGCSCQRK